jgi:uncharacterized membrane protein
MKSAHMFLAVSFALLSLTVTAPLLAHLGFSQAADLNYRVFLGFCHQLGERSFSIFGYKMAVCARCFGIYAGILAGAIAYVATSSGGKAPRGWLLLAACAPLAIDGSAQLLGLRESSNLLRLATGLLFGFVLSQYLLPAAEDAVIRLRAKSWTLADIMGSNSRV